MTLDEPRAPRPQISFGSQTWIAVFALILVFLAPVVAAQTDVHAPIIAAADRKPAPLFRLMAKDGKPSRLSDFQGKVVLLNFWATECGGCVLEIPSIMDVQVAYRNRKFTVVGISMDISYENLKSEDEAWARVRPFAAKSKINYPILMGRESLYKEFGLTQLPDTLLIDKHGRVAALYVGIISKDNVEANIRQLLSE